jgi:hypothetical protein
MNKIKSIDGSTPAGMVVPETVELLERALEKAKSGELRSVAIAGIKQNSNALTQWHSEGELFALCGAVSWLSSRMVEL